MDEDLRGSENECQRAREVAEGGGGEVQEANQGATTYHMEGVATEEDALAPPCSVEVVDTRSCGCVPSLHDAWKRNLAFSWPSNVDRTQGRACQGRATDDPRGTGSTHRTSDTSVSAFASRCRKTPTSVGILAARLSTNTWKGHTSVRFSDEPVEQGRLVERIRNAVLLVLDNSYVTAFIILLSTWSLFSDDIRLAATERSADRVFEWTSIFTLVFFALEIVLESVAREGYFFGVYFWLDLLAAASLFFFIPSLVDAIFTEDSIYNTNEVQSWNVEAVLDICLSLFLVAVLGLGAFFFNRDVNRLAVEPIQRMLAKIVKVSENPLQASYKRPPPSKQSKSKYETHKLDLAISKICGLLAIGFGDAGAEIIAENMKYDGDLNPMVPGKKVVAVFGFCDIKKFTETTELLQEEIMEFVNTVASIVHARATSQSGSANKNMGDGFLIVWKFPDFVTAQHLSDGKATET
eukprot:jgi/Pico_ML_1/50772/g1921.t1